MSGVSSFKFEKDIVFSRGRVNFLEGEVIISLTGGMSCLSTGEESRSIGKGDMIEASKVDGPDSIVKGLTSSIKASNFLSNGTNGGLIHSPFLGGYLSVLFQIPVSLAGGDNLVQYDLGVFRIIDLIYHILEKLSILRRNNQLPILFNTPNHFFRTR